MKIRKMKSFLWFVFVVVLFWLGVRLFFDIKIVPRNGREEIGWKKELVFLKDKAYFLAGKYNPKGDFLPDWLDDILKDEIKSGWRFWRGSEKEKVDK